jgi:hypothetical protein
MFFAPHYAAAEPCVVRIASTMLKAAPDDGATAVSQLKYGEIFAVLDLAGGWAWGYGQHDHYVGYLPAAALREAGSAPTHRVVAPKAPLFARADIKAPVIDVLPIGATIVGSEDGRFLVTRDGFVHCRHVGPIAHRATDPVAVGERLLGAPYLWGGRGADGIDCSGLVQLALDFAGIAAPRDSDQQRTLGRPLAPDEGLRRGDLVFFPGHVGLMADGERLLHANAHHMATVIEPLADVIARLEAAGEARPIAATRRID